MWWETTPLLIVAWLTALTLTIALIRRVWRGLKFGRRVSVGLQRIIEIGSTEEWPNGAESLPAAMTEIYKRQGQTHDLLESYIVAHRADHAFDRGAD